MKHAALHLTKLQTLLSRMSCWITRSPADGKHQYDVELYWMLISRVDDDSIYMLQSKKENKNILRIFSKNRGYHQYKLVISPNLYFKLK